MYFYSKLQEDSNSHHANFLFIIRHSIANSINDNTLDEKRLLYKQISEKLGFGEKDNLDISSVLFKNANRNRN